MGWIARGLVAIACVASCAQGAGAVGIAGPPAVEHRGIQLGAAGELPPALPAEDGEARLAARVALSLHRLAVGSDPVGALSLGTRLATSPLVVLARHEAHALLYVAGHPGVVIEDAPAWSRARRQRAAELLFLWPALTSPADAPAMARPVPTPVPEPPLLPAVAAIALAMLHARGRQRTAPGVPGAR